MAAARSESLERTGTELNANVKSLLHELESLGREIRDEAGLAADVLEDAATELQVDIEMCRFDHGDASTFPIDPYGEFELLATLFSLEQVGDEFESVLIGLSERQVYLACAWNYVSMGAGLLRQEPPFPNAAHHARRLKSAAQRLLCDVRTRAQWLIPCSSPYPATSQRRH